MYRDGDIFTLLDETWGLLFSAYYKPIQDVQLPHHIARIKVLNVDGGYVTITLMELVPEEGRVHIPTNVVSRCSMFEIENALALSEAKRNLSLT